MRNFNILVFHMVPNGQTIIIYLEFRFIFHVVDVIIMMMFNGFDFCRSIVKQIQIVI